MLLPVMRASAARGDHRRAGVAGGDRATGVSGGEPQADPGRRVVADSVLTGHEEEAQLVQALDAFVDVLSRITDETPGADHGFYDGLCAAICRQTSIDR